MTNKIIAYVSNHRYSAIVKHQSIRAWVTILSCALAMSIFIGSTVAQASQSFLAPSSWVQGLSVYNGYGYDQPRLIADLNGDGRQDIVAFGNAGVTTGISDGFRFDSMFSIADFGRNNGWRSARHVRLLGDINGDRRADIVGFGNGGVFTSLFGRAQFGSVNFVIADFGYDQGWRVERHIRTLADVNGDGRQDIVAFGDHGVWLALADGSGGFTSPVFAIADLGYNQGWRPDKHVRLTGDINGDGRHDILAFGDHGVWLALSTGTGFGAPQLVMRDLGYVAGSWRVDRHIRTLSDINNDGRQDIVAFGDAGVFVAYSEGASFGPLRFLLNDFGYNSGWRVASHPRFVVDLNGDGYKDIVGFGQRSVYRALGNSSFGFDPNLGVLRDLVATRNPFDRSDSSVVAPRFVGDVNGDRLPDLIAFDGSDTKVALSSTAPPPPPPAAPSNLRITGVTPSTISIAWDDNSDNESRFLIYYSKSGGSVITALSAANTTSRQIGGLEENTIYCFAIEAENLYGVSAQSSRVCQRTGRRLEETTIYMSRQVIIEGPVPYVGSFGPIHTGAVITNINFPTQFRPVLLVKPGFSTEDCNNSNAVVQVHGDMTNEQKIAIWGTASITLGPTDRLNFVGCTTDPQLPGSLPVNITWRTP